MQSSSRRHAWILLLACVLSARVSAQQAEEGERCDPGSSCYAHWQAIERTNALADDMARSNADTAKNNASALAALGKIKQGLPAGAGVNAVVVADLALAMRNISESKSLDAKLVRDLVDTLAAKTSDPTKTPIGKAAKQIVLDGPLARYYEDGAEIRFVLATVPDPRIPRNRRTFDLTSDAIVAAFADENYLFDRYYFPWKGDAGDDPGLRRPGDSDETPCEPAPGSDAKKDSCDSAHAAVCQSKSCRNVPQCTQAGPETQRESCKSACIRACRSKPRNDFGIITFRRDQWRDLYPPVRSTCAARTCVVAVLLVADRMSQGVALDPAKDAAYYAIQNEIGNQRNHECTDDELAFKDRKLDMVGPAYSSSFSSLRALIPALGVFGIQKIKLIVPSATADSNALAFASPDRRPFAFEDESIPGRLYALRLNFFGDVWQALQARNFKASTPYAQAQIVGAAYIAAPDSSAVSKWHDWTQSFPSSAQHELLVEDSTWGKGFADSLSNFRDRHIAKHYFPPNVRELAVQSTPPDKGYATNNIASLMRGGSELALDLDSGSELPPQMAQTTSRSLELQLDSTLGGLERPDTITIIATDVRDKLYMARAARRFHPGAQLIFIEADSLLYHPDFIDATRGALVIGTAPLRVPVRLDEVWKHTANDSDSCPSEVHISNASSPSSKEGSREMRDFAADGSVTYYAAMRCAMHSAGWCATQNSTVYRVTRSGFERIDESEKGLLIRHSRYGIVTFAVVWLAFMFRVLLFGRARDNNAWA
ncbi:MAG: hypothetical protein ABIQ70_03530 [Dokdonella sp.]